MLRMKVSWICSCFTRYCYSRLTGRAEWWLDLREGVCGVNHVLKSKFSFSTIQSILHEHTRLKIYSHGQKYWHPCTSENVCITSPRKLLQLQMLWYSHVYLFCLHWKNTKKSEKKSQIWCHSTQNSKNGLHKIICTFSKLQEIIAFKHVMLL